MYVHQSGIARTHALYEVIFFCVCIHSCVFTLAECVFGILWYDGMNVFRDHVGSFNGREIRLAKLMVNGVQKQQNHWQSHKQFASVRYYYLYAVPSAERERDACRMCIRLLCAYGFMRMFTCKTQQPPPVTWMFVS